MSECTALTPVVWCGHEDEVAFPATVMRDEDSAPPTQSGYKLPAYYRPTRGRVLIDGVDIEGVVTESLRNQVSLMCSRST